MQVMNQHDLQVAADFFFCFARFEYALKACGYVTDNPYVKPDWNRYSKTVKPAFEHPQSPAFRMALQYYTNQPPKRQVLKGGRLQWEDSPIPSGSIADQILTHIRTVRNNLFHGGKFKGRYLAAPERSEELMKHAMVILDACLSYDEDLRIAYKYEE